MPVARCAVSLFSGGGIGDLGVEYGADVPVIAFCECLPDRAAILSQLYPKATVHLGDIEATQAQLVAGVRARLGPGHRPWLVNLSPPCQGMSTNGAGRIRAAVDNGTRPAVDARNRLVVPGLDVVVALQPEWVLMENVRRMATTSVRNELGADEPILDMVRRRLPQYTVQAKVLDASRYGVPQRRDRLITIAHRRTDDPRLYHPPPLSTAVTLHRAIGHLPPLDARDRPVDPTDPLHRVPKWNDAQHFCMVHTPEGHTAFDNATCVECDCYHPDPTTATCDACGARLPRPLFDFESWACPCGAHNALCRTRCRCGHARTADDRVVRGVRVVRAFKTAYRRMRADEPASTLTTNSGVISSDVKGHPTQARVLSLREILIVASVGARPGFAPAWPTAALEVLPDRLLRHVLGEAIPPLLMQHLVRRLLHLTPPPDAPPPPPPLRPANGP